MLLLLLLLLLRLLPGSLAVPSLWGKRGHSTFERLQVEADKHGLPKRRPSQLDAQLEESNGSSVNFLNPGLDDGESLSNSRSIVYRKVSSKAEVASHAHGFKFGMATRT